MKKSTFLVTLDSLLMTINVQSYKVQRFVCVHAFKFQYTNPQPVFITLLSDKPYTAHSRPFLANNR